jgi:hypothetical protein
MNNRLTVVQYMQHLATRGTNVANQIKSIIDNLYNKANVWYNQNPNYNALGVELSYIVVPSILVGDPAINAALINAYQNIPNIRVYQTNTDDKLVCYRLKGALPMYALRDMQKWQDAYESAARRMLHLNESGSGIYDPETGLAWEDYPALAMKNDVRLPDPATGRISREGLFIRDRLDPFFEEALKYGIIARKQNPNGEYYYECYCLCRLGWDYTFDLEDYQQFNPDRTYQTGTALLSYIASRNSSTLASITRPVALSGQGNFSQPVANPALALDMAKRSLRRDVIMYRDIKTTLSNLMPVLRAIDNRNTAIKQARVRLLLPKLIATSAVIRNEQNKWVMPGYPDPGTNMTLYNMSSANNLDNPIYNKELYYAVLAERFSEKMHNDEGISGYTNECWNRVVGDDQELTYSDCLANLNVFKEEASKFIADYCGEGKTGARRMLAGELCVDQEKLSVIIGDYQNLQRIINALSQ